MADLYVSRKTAPKREVCGYLKRRLYHRRKLFRVSDLSRMDITGLYVSRKLNIQALLILVLQFF